MPAITFTSPPSYDSICRDALCAIRAASLIDFDSPLAWAQWERRLAQAALDGDPYRVAAEIRAWEDAALRRRHALCCDL